MSAEWSDPVVAMLCTISMLIGYLTGNRETRVDEEIITAEGWHQHVTSALFVARRSLPSDEPTQEVRR